MKLNLGISAYYHDSAAALAIDGDIVSAAHEERFSRIKHDKSFPFQSISFCLEKNNISINELESITFYEDIELKSKRIKSTIVKNFPTNLPFALNYFSDLFSGRIITKKKLHNDLLDLGLERKLLDKIVHMGEHHRSHAASTFYLSPFNKATVVVMDGVGEWDTTSIWIGDGTFLNKISSIKFPHSIGLLYSTFTSFLGFKVNSGEYKVMGLAPYGEPLFHDLIMENLIDGFIFEDFKLNMNFFSFDRSFKMFNKNFENLFNCKQRLPETPLLKVHMDIAASIQSVCNHLTEKVVEYAVKRTGIKNIALSGGVALNCVSNSNILKQDWCGNLWVQPASGDAGGSIGCALSSYYLNKDLKNKRKLKDFSCYLGPEYNNEQIENSLIEHEAVFKKMQFQKLLKIISKELSSGKVVGWFQGSAEFGPRALGNRSIIADPRIETMQKDLNLKIKFRESFRPFAPAVLSEMSDEYFKKQKTDSPFMLLVTEVKNKIELPAVTHLDGSARLQTVKKSENKVFHSLLTEFYKQTGCPVLINTSFNVRNEPMVLKPSDAYRCFMATNMDVLVVGDYILYKEDQPLSNVSRYYDNYEMD